jgi:hypothetical protein
MADSIMSSLFGISPEIFQQSRDEQTRKQAIEFAQLDPYARTNALAFMGGRGLGNIVGGALGAEDPQLQRISQFQNLAGQADLTSPQGYATLGQQLIQAGDTARGMEAIKISQEMELKESQITRNLRERQGFDPIQQIIRSGKFTPESIEKYSKSGAISDLRAIEKPEKYSGFAQTLIDAGLTPGTEPFIRRMNEYAQNKLEGAKKGSGNVIIGGITIDSGAASKEAGKNIGAKVANIEEQYSLQTAIQDATKLVGQGIYAGAFGPEKGFIAKYSGGMIGDSKKVQNTEVFLANIGEIVIPRLQQFGGNDSNEELKYLQKVVAGEQRLEPESMKRILESAEKKTRNNIARLQKQVETGKTGGDLPLQPIQPAPSAPRVTKRLNPATGKIESVTGE